MSTGHSEDIESTGQLNTLHNNMSTGHSKDVKSTGPLKTLNNNMSTSPSEDVELIGQLGDVKSAGLPSHEQEEDNSILQPGTPEFGSVEEPQIRVQEPQSKEVFVSAQGPMVKADRVLSVNIIDNVVLVNWRYWHRLKVMVLQVMVTAPTCWKVICKTLIC